MGIPGEIRCEAILRSRATSADDDGTDRVILWMKLKKIRGGSELQIPNWYGREKDEGRSRGNDLGASASALRRRWNAVHQERCIRAHRRAAVPFERLHKSI